MTKLPIALLAFALALSGCGGTGDDPSPLASPSPSADASGLPPIPDAGPAVAIMALGDSLFAGYGVARDESYPARLETALRARGVNARIANASVSGDTTADGLQRLAFALEGQTVPPQVVLISLGGNDILRGLPPEQTRRNLDAILAELDRRGIRAVLMGMVAPPNLGADYRAAFDPIYPSLARAHKAVLVPFFLQAVIGKSDLVQADHIHPTARGIEEIVAATLPAVTSALPKPAPAPRR